MSRPLFRVERPGLLTTLQDQGRFGRQREGMPVAGAMDPFAGRVANLLVGNARGAAVLEVTLLGPTLVALADVWMAVCGADLTAQVDSAPLPLWRTVRLSRGQTLHFGPRRSGARAYLAVAGGFDVPDVLGSKSTFLRAGLGGHKGRALQAGDVLAGEGANVAPQCRLTPDLVPVYTQEVRARVIPGPHVPVLGPAAWEAFLAARYLLTPQSDRMGYRLGGPALPIADGGRGGLLSEAVPWGGVQVPPDGRPIVLMADRQTTGGYPLVAVVATADRPALAQLAPGDALSFEAVTLAEAQDAWKRQERLLSLLEASALRPRLGTHLASPVGGLEHPQPVL